jgi:hypothetical protein
MHWPESEDEERLLKASLAAARRALAKLIKALRHPTLWHCLLSVAGMIQSRVLDGEAQALEQLASHFLSWFCHKVRARGNRARDEEMIDVLKEIARHCDPRRSSRYMKKDWITHASNTPHMNTGLAASFFEEGLSAGLIVRDTGGWWQWRHPFIGEHLAMQPASSEDEQ